MDDRTITTCGSTADPDLDAALHYTTEFDAALGLSENPKKRQRWSSEVPSSIEHLGLLTQPMLPDAPILPRGGWKKVGKVIAHLAALPGPASVRERLAAAFVRPHFTWASPLQHPPPADLAHQLLHAVLLTRCSWYCAGRWWADRIQLHPAISAGLQAFKPAFRGLPHSAALHCSWKAHAKTFGLTLAGYAWSGAPLLKACADDNARILSAVETGRAPGQRPLTFQADTEAGQHALRIIGRVRMLERIRHSRLDSEGAELIDPEAQSDPLWTKWVGTLCPKDATALRLWRAGAVGSPTRHSHRKGFLPTCLFCDARLGSLRHLWQDCPRWTTERAVLALDFGVPLMWWTSQPRVTSKSGWITFGAADTIHARARLQIMTCRLGIQVVLALHRYRDLSWIWSGDCLDVSGLSP